MTTDFERFEGLVGGNGNPRWNQSYYYNFYDPQTRVGAFIRFGFLENQNELNTWFVVFKDGLPLFTRTNINLPYTADRPASGFAAAGMRVVAEVPLKKTVIELTTDDCTARFVWDELAPMEDCIALSHDKDGSFAREMAHVHLEGTSTVSGWVEHRGVRTEVNGTGFRDIGAGPRNWDALKYYRLAWPVFENGMAFSGIHGVSTGGGSAYMRMFYDGKRWVRVESIEDRQVEAAEPFVVASAQWKFTDELGRSFEFTAKPLFQWLFPLDTFVLREQLMEYRMADGTLGYGLYETGYRLPWQGIDR